MKFKHFLVLLALCSSPLLTSQEDIQLKDSLYTIERSIHDHIDNIKYKDALELSAKLISKASEKKNDYYTYMGHELVGTIYLSIKDTFQARISYEKALELAKESKRDSLLSWAYFNLGNIESDGKVNYQKGIDYYKKSIRINEKIIQQGNAEMSYDIIAANLNIGWTYLDEGQEERALPYLLKAKKSANKDSITNKYALLSIKTLLGRYYIKNKEYQKAENELTTVSKIVLKEDLPIEGSEAFKYLSNLYEITGDHEKAFASLKQQKAYDDKLYEAKKLSEIQAAGAKFNLEEYERSLEIAKKEQEYTKQLVSNSRRTTIVFVIATIILFITLLIIYRMWENRKNLVKRLREKNHQLIQAKEDAEHLSYLKTQFFSTVSHELRTPLYGVIGIASILLEDKNIKSHNDDLQSLKFSADYLLSLINDVLLINKMEASGIRLEYTPFKISSLINNIIRSFEFSLEQNNNKLHLDIDKTLSNGLIGDSVRLSQILMNLIGNAIKFNENGNIWLSIQKVAITDDGKHRAKFVIKDDGIGIPKEKHATIFEEFSQVENSHYNYQGTGLGLPIVKKLLDLHGSEINLESEVGKGTSLSFIIDLEPINLAEEAIDINTTLTIEGNSIHTIQNVHILVVDDNRINQKITQKILENRNFKCSLANDGAEAVALVKTTKYDLILMDIHMPNIDGIEATKQIRKFNAYIPIIALTAVEMGEIIQEIQEAGMNDIILKPYDISQFITTILRNLDPRSTRFPKSKNQLSTTSRNTLVV